MSGGRAEQRDFAHPTASPATERAFFGRRKGHRLKPSQLALFETLLPRLALDLEALPARLTSCFPAPVDGVQLEIGFGSGEQLIHAAQANPRVGFIGIEPFVNGMARVLAAIAASAISNVRLHHGDAADILPRLPDRSLARVDLIYPDPWPKRRHWKRRFIQGERVAEIARILKPGGEFRFVTDVADYAGWTLRHFGRSPNFIWTAERADDWRNPWPEFLQTRYEAKAKRAGRLPCYLIFRRTEDVRRRTNDGE
jgi:tRNA (guanine-N7-)-methyltransferase